MNGKSGKITLKSDKTVIESTILKFLTDYLSEERKSCQFKIRLILSELLANSHFHGNQGDSEKNVVFEFRFDGRILYLDIRDEGLGFSIRNDKEMLSFIEEEFGRGLLIIREIAEEITANEAGLISVKVDLSKL